MMCLLLTVTMRLTNIPGIVLVFARMYIPCNVMQFNALFIIFTLDIKQCPIYVSQKLTCRSISNSSMVFAYLILIGIDVVILICLLLFNFCHS